MDFTREPVIETVITPKEGCKLAVRNSKGVSQEEFFVDAVEIVSFGNSFFFRSFERPKSFFVPVTDYEILEVRETRMVLKNVGIDRTIRIGGGKEAGKVKAKEPKGQTDKDAIPVEPRVEKKRERRRRRRRGQEELREETATEEVQTESEAKGAPVKGEEGDQSKGKKKQKKEEETTSSGLPASPPRILEPPKTLISETISQYKENEQYKDVFFNREEDREEVASEEVKEEGVSEEEEVRTPVDAEVEEEGEVMVPADPFPEETSIENVSSDEPSQKASEEILELSEEREPLEEVEEETPPKVEHSESRVE